ncbi:MULTISPECIES: acyl-CoA dehydrogenase family protein [Pseudomonas]|uniref:Acyl-CoA dehydrogenase n=2 Tax=Pseudomonadaceae TaxID=135621 RepID=A0A0D0L531_9PSED|nr:MULTISPECIES: acyl-CoA dehydrogenase family protein [Pseudomonas]KIQ04820.1 acyl-CoA dehydrogenase [Pseudomonas fulva]MCW2292502.1 alkylation response protein AidB-like acyl-CoA dehydrogenase [Pseudomonas sp. BIGb0408]NYH72927.1 alkylation response protein AidB-like acyl-CoA dehydrogenase [Pseudomonas flavescens]
MTQSADTLAFPTHRVSPERDEARFTRQLDEITATLAASAARFDRSGEFPAENFALLQRHGLLGLTVPKTLGGGGADLPTARRVISAVAKGEPSTALILVMQYLQHFRLQQNLNWPEQLRRQVGIDAVENGALINAFRVEPELGTPARGGLPATTARRTREGWRLSGRKIYSTGSHGLTWYLVWARSDDADPLVGGYLVHRDTPGIRIVEDWDHLGMRATCSHEVQFDDVLIPLDHAVSVSPWSAPRPELDGEGMLWMSVLLPAIYDGVAQAARDWLVGFLEQRTPSNLGAPLSSLPRFQEIVGRIDTLLFANRTLLDSAAAGQVEAAHAGQIKQLVSSNAIRAVELAIEASGNPGLSRKNPLERHFRDVLCSRIHTPQDDVALSAVGRSAFAQAREAAQ